MFSFTYKKLFKINTNNKLINKVNPLVYIYNYFYLFLKLLGNSIHYSFIYSVSYKKLKKYVMASVSFLYASTFSTLTACLLLHYLYILYKMITVQEINQWTIAPYVAELGLIKNIDFFFAWFLQFFSFICFKIIKKDITLLLTVMYTYIIITLLYMFIVFILSQIFKVDRRELNTIFLIFIFFFTILITFFFVDNLILLVIALELVAILYYFFFLQQTHKNLLTFLKLKNLLNLYLWFSFITLILLGFSVIVCTYYVGSVKFSQLECFRYSTTALYWTLLLLAIFWKIALPGFHFFKLELYQYMSTLFLLIFSSLSLLLNCFIINFLLVVFGLILKIQFFYFLIFALIFNIFLNIKGFLTTTVYQFLAISSLNSLLFCAIMSMLNVKN